MSYNINSLIQDMNGILHGTTTNKVTGFTNVVQRAAKKLLLDIDPAETKRVKLLPGVVTGTVFDYTLPTDLKGDSIIDLYNYNIPRSDVYSQSYSQNFSLGTASAISQPWIGVSAGIVSQNLNIEWQNGVRVLHVNNRGTLSNQIINELNSLSDNGVPILQGSATDLTLNQIKFVDETEGSLQFVAPINTTTAGILITSGTALDISDLYATNTAYFWFYCEKGYPVQSITVKYGLDAGNYYESILTTNTSGNPFQDGWNLCSFNFTDSAVSGVPGYSIGTYINILITHSGVIENLFRLNLFTCKQGQTLMIKYYSKYMFQDPITREFIENIPSTGSYTDTIINLDTDSYNLLVYLTALFCFQQINDENSSYDIDFWQKQYDQGVQMYKNRYKSEITKPRQNYYTVNRGRYGWGLRN